MQRSLTIQSSGRKPCIYVHMLHLHMFPTFTEMAEEVEKTSSMCSWMGQRSKLLIERPQPGFEAVLTTPSLCHHITVSVSDLMSMSRHHLSKHPLTSVWPIFLMCTIYNQSLSCFSITLFGGSLHDPSNNSSNPSLHNLHKCGGNTDSSHDWIKVSLEL